MKCFFIPSQILSDTLRDEESTEEEKSEAAGLLAQVSKRLFF